MANMREGGISIWFFIGIALLVNGVLILGAGLYELLRPPDTRSCCFTCTPASGGERCCWRSGCFIRSTSRRGGTRNRRQGAAYGRQEDDVRPDRREPRVLPRPPGAERPRRDDPGAADGRASRSSCSSPEETKHGAVETREEAAALRRRCSAGSASSIDGVIVTLPNFGDERAIADTLRLAGLNVPVLVQATPDTPREDDHRDRRDSFCGKMSACNNLQQYGIPYSLTTLHTEAPGLAGVRAATWSGSPAVCRVVNGLRNLRVGAIGARPAAFNTVRYSEKILEASGISVETARPFGDPRAHRPHEGRRRGRAGQAGGDHGRTSPTSDVPPAALLKMAKLGAVIDRLDAGHRRARSAPCSAGPRSRSTSAWCPARVMSMMSNELMSSACEVDICGALGMHALQLASETPSALLDWNNNYGDDPDKAVCFHCSNLPKHFFEDVTMDYQEIIAGTVGKREHLRHLRGPREGRPDDLRALLHRRRAPGRSAATWARGGSPTIRWRPSAAPAWWRSRACRACCATSARRASSTTSRPISRRVAAPVHEAATNYLGWDMYWHDGTPGGGSMAIVAGVDFGTLSVRVSIVDSERGRLGSGVAEYPLHRKQEDPDHATQSHADHMRRSGGGHARARSRTPGVAGEQVEAMALDTTGSSVIPVGEGLEPLDDYYLWCDHRAWHEAARDHRGRAARRASQAIEWCGGVYSSEWGFSKLLHWLRHNPEKRAEFVTRASSTATWWPPCCAASPIPARSRAASAPWATSGCGTRRWAACRPRSSWPRSIRCSPACATSCDGRYATSDQLAGHAVARVGAASSGLRAGIPIPVGAFDAHWDAIGAGVPHRRRGQRHRHLDLHHRPSATADELMPGRLRRGAGLGPPAAAPASKPGSRPRATSSTPSPAAPARRRRAVAAAWRATAPARPACSASPGTTATAPCWSTPNCGGVTLGWNLTHTAQDELFAAIEGTALPHPRHPRADGGARRADPPRHQRAAASRRRTRC